MPDRADFICVLVQSRAVRSLLSSPDSADGRFHAQVSVGDRQEIYGLKSSGFRDRLVDGYVIDQPEPPSQWAIRRVVGMLEARARFNADSVDTS
jgi:hypothetical protein